MLLVWLTQRAFQFVMKAMERTRCVSLLFFVFSSLTLVFRMDVNWIDELTTTIGKLSDKIEKYDAKIDNEFAKSNPETHC
jgi:hypothetical protein